MRTENSRRFAKAQSVTHNVSSMAERESMSKLVRDIAPSIQLRGAWTAGPAVPGESTRASCIDVHVTDVDVTSVGVCGVVRRSADYPTIRYHRVGSGQVHMIRRRRVVVSVKWGPVIPTQRIDGPIGVCLPGRIEV